MSLSKLTTILSRFLIRSPPCYDASSLKLQQFSSEDVRYSVLELLNDYYDPDEVSPGWLTACHFTFVMVDFPATLLINISAEQVLRIVDDICKFPISYYGEPQTLLTLCLGITNLTKCSQLITTDKERMYEHGLRVLLRSSAERQEQFFKAHDLPENELKSALQKYQCSPDEVGFVTLQIIAQQTTPGVEDDMSDWYAAEDSGSESGEICCQKIPLPVTRHKHKIFSASRATKPTRRSTRIPAASYVTKPARRSKRILARS